MSIPTYISNIQSVLHTLANDDVVDNTYGKVTSIKMALDGILRDMPITNVEATLGQEQTDSLKAIATKVEESRWLFGIPEQWLIDQVLAAAKSVQERIEG